MNWKNLFRRKTKVTLVFDSSTKIESLEEVQELLKKHMAKCKESYTKLDNSKLRIEYNLCQEFLTKLSD